MTPSETRTKAKSVPMLERSARVPMSKRPEGMATTKPATQVEKAGVRKSGWTLEKTLGSRPSRDMENHTRDWPSLIDEDRGDHAHDARREDDQADPVELDPPPCRMREFFEGIDDGRGIAHHRLPGHEAGEADGDGDVKDGADDERGDDADGQVALRVAALLGRGGDGIEANVGEEDDGAAGEHARPAVGHEGVPVAGVNEADGREDEDQNGDQLERHHACCWRWPTRECRAPGSR